MNINNKLKKEFLEKKILLVGGTGFIGQYLSHRLAVEDNDITVFHFSPLSRGKKIKGIRYCKVDLTQLSSLPLIKPLTESAGIIVIMTQPSPLIINNIISSIGPKNNLEKIVYLSSLLIYPDSPAKNNENIIPAPETDYEKNKYREELLISDFCKTSGIRLCIARLSNVYGDVQNKGIVNRIFSSLIEGTPLTIYGDGSNIRDYIFIEDAINLLKFLIFRDQKNSQEIFNICTGNGYALLDLIKAVEDIARAKISFINKDPVQEKKISIGDNQKILNSMHYKFEYNLTGGLRKSYNNYLKCRAIFNG